RRMVAHGRRARRSLLIAARKCRPTTREQESEHEAAYHSTALRERVADGPLPSSRGPGKPDGDLPEGVAERSGNSGGRGPLPRELRGSAAGACAAPAESVVQHVDVRQ